MDLSIVFNVVLLVFTLMLLGAIVYIPYKILQACIRGIAKTTLKTYQVFVPTKK